MATVTGQFADTPTCGQSSRGLIDSRTSPVAETFDLKVSGQFRCARYKCGISACKQSNLCCYDVVCTNLCCANDIVILTGPREQNGAFGWVKSWKRQITKNTTRKPRKWQWRPLANEEKIKL